MFLHEPCVLCHLCGLLWLLFSGEAKGVSDMAVYGFFYRLGFQSTYLWCYVHSLRAIVITPSLGHPGTSGEIFQSSSTSKAKCLSFLSPPCSSEKGLVITACPIHPSMHQSIIPFSIPASSCTQGLRRICWSLSQLWQGKVTVIPCTSRKCIAAQPGLYY